MMKNKLLTNELVTRESQYSFFKHIGMLPNPIELFGGRGKNYDTLRDLKNDPHVWSCIQSRKSGLLAMEYKIIGDGGIAELINDLFDSLNIYSMLSDILEAPLFGFQPLEILWTYSSSAKMKLVPKQIIAKPQEWFFFDTIGNLKIKSSENKKGIPAPMEKILCVTHESSYQNPYGTSLLAKCYWACTFKNGGLRFWVNFMERFGMPVLLGKYTRGAGDEEIQKLAEVLADMSENSVIVSPEDIEITMQEAARTSSVDLYYQLIKLCNAEISKAILSQTLTTELDSGSYAASQTHFSIRKEVIRSDVHLVEKTVNQLIQLILEINRIDKKVKFKLLEFEVNKC